MICQSFSFNTAKRPSNSIYKFTNTVYNNGICWIVVQPNQTKISLAATATSYGCEEFVSYVVYKVYTAQ